MRAKEIIFVVGNYKNGGVPMRATNLANEFGKIGYKVIILVTKEIGKEVFFELHKNVELVPLAKYYELHRNSELVGQDKKKQERLIKKYKRIRYVTKVFAEKDKILEKRICGLRKNGALRSFFVEHKNAVVIPFGISYFEAVYHVTRDLSCKIIYAERNAPEVEFPQDTKEKRYLFHILNCTNTIVVQTQNEKEFYAGKVKTNIVVIHNPIKDKLPEPFVGERRKVIVNFCRISEQKNLKLLIDAFAQLSKEYPEYELQIFGNVVEECEKVLCEELKDYIFRKSLDNKVHILPPSAQVHDKVKDCKIFVSSSDFEGLSNSMIEAMAIGLPCVCTDCLGGGAREMIEHEENGLLVPMKNIDALYLGMKRFVEDDELARRCGQNASKIVEEMSVEKIADKWLQVIEKL